MLSGAVVILVPVILLIVLLVFETPVGFALGVAGTVGLIFVMGIDLTQAQLASTMYGAVSSYALTLIPMYVLLGILVLYAQIAGDLYAFASRALRRFPAGLGIATIGACAGFAAVTGSTAATVATIGRLSVDEMRQYGYSAPLSAGIIAAGGTIGILIPPSIILVLYGIVAGESIGRLLMAGIIPGIISAALYMVVVMWQARSQVDQSVAHAFRAAQASAGVEEPTLRRGVSAVLKISTLGFLVVMGIYTGQFTVIESGALAATTAIVLLMWAIFRIAEVKWRDLRLALFESAGLTSMIFMLIIGGSLFGRFIEFGGYATAFTDWIATLPLPPLAVVAVLLVALVPLGMVLDGLSILVITVPLMHPVVTDLGFDGVWFAILVVKMIELGLITPPVGLNVYLAAGTAPGITVEDGFRGVWPFGLMDVATVTLFFLVPGIVVWLPSLVV